MKTYRLKIPEMISYKDAKKILPKMQTFENEEIIDQALVDFADIPKSWLTEIKEPLSFEEWYKDAFHVNHSREEHKRQQRMTWEAALENYKLPQEKK